LSRSFAFAFACVPGDIEIRSAFLAASLAQSVRGRCELIAVAARSAEGFACKSSTLALFDRLGVRRVVAGDAEEIDIECLRVATACEKLVLLDPAQLLLGDFQDAPRFSMAFNACPAIQPPDVGDESAWRTIFQSCGTHLPGTRGFSEYTNQFFPLCFDPGFVAVPAHAGFGDVWRHCFQTIRQIQPQKSASDIRKVALAVAAAKLNLDVDVLDERFGQPIWLRPIDERNPPIFARYDNPENIAREPSLLLLLAKLLEDYPELREIAAGEASWQRVITLAVRASKEIRAREPMTPEIIITGIPRSGTSYLCHLLHRMSNCVVLNEPPEAIPLLRNTKTPLALANFLRDRRRDVLLGIPIANKVESGQIIQDTAKLDKIETYTPQVDSPNFVLGIKETLPFLMRLPMLRQIFPNARFIACVRNPFDTIASWKGSFAHLNIAEVVRQPIGNPIDPWLTVRQQQELRAIAAIIDPASRRAAWWRFLANLILESLDRLILIRYEDLVTNPRQALAKILDGLPAGREVAPIEPSSIRRRRELLGQDDLLAIRALCAQPAQALGYSECESQAGK
jgi:hypothetical protein